ncbi:MAG TPA: ABC transporter substrate-binding protein [Chloroflexota bacterium]|jgi:NitT/TauT family transport system substrate-binding protein
MDELQLLLPSPAASNAVCTLARREGIFAKHGLAVAMEVIGDSTNLLRQTEHGGAFVAYLAAAAVVEAVLNGANLVLFAGMVNRPFHSIVCRPEIASADELRGKRVGFSGRNDELSCGLALAQVGLRLGDDVTGVRVSGPPNERIAALRDGTVDAVAISPPATFRAKKAGFRELVSLADLPGEYQSGSCATNRAFLAEHRDVVVRFTRALIEAVKLFKADREKAIAALGEHTGGTDREELEDSWRIFAMRCMPDVPALSLPGLRFVMDTVVQHPAARDHVPDEFVDLGVVPEATGV